MIGPVVVLIPAGDSKECYAPAIEVHVVASYCVRSGDQVEAIVVPVVRDGAIVVLFHAVTIAIVGIYPSCDRVQAVLGIELHSIGAVPSKIPGSIVSVV